MPRIVLAALGLLLFAPALQAQEDLNIFGYFQSQYRYSVESAEVPIAGVVVYDGRTRTSFQIQHLNVLASKNLSDDFSAFLNAELVNTFDSEKGFGELRLQEAWVRYRSNRRFSARLGLMIPTFNNLNEVRNRAPLLPYVFRPIVYESSFYTLTYANTFIPQRAYVEASGTLPVSENVLFDYSAHFGTAEEDFASSDFVGTTSSGSDTTSYHAGGGRIGLRYDRFKAGVSGTYDIEGIGIATVDGAPRIRYGADLSGVIGPVFFEAEYIGVSVDISDEDVQTLAFIQANVAPTLPTNLDRTFYYGTLGVNFLDDQAFAYASYNFLSGGITDIQIGDQKFYSVGGGYKPTFGLTFKAQYLHFVSEGTPFLEFEGNYVFLGASVLF